MKYYHDLYMSDNLISKRTDIITKIKNDQWQFEKYLVVLTENEKNHLEFFNAVLLLQRLILKENLFVIGIADGYQGALEMVKQITEEVYEKTQGVNIRDYLLAKEREYEESNE